MANTFTIYALVDCSDRSEFRWIGQTQDLNARMLMHRADDYGACAAWKRALPFFGRDYQAIELDVVVGTRADALSREKEFIDRFKSSMRLLNACCFKERTSAIPISVVQSYLSSVVMIQQLWRDRRLSGKSMRASHAAFQLARAIDGIELEYQIGMFTHGKDKFGDRVRNLLFESERRRKVRKRKAAEAV